jgi:hypothetical protein
MNFINSTNFAWERYEDKIIFDRAFAQSLATELESNHISQGTILLVTEEMLLDPAYVFNYNNTNEVKFPGRYHVTIVADRFDSRGGKIDLTGAIGSTPAGAADGQNGFHATKEHGDGTDGTDGDSGKLGGKGGPGMNIKIFCEELVNIETISNGGDGGRGGRGGDGGDGGNGKTIHVLIDHKLEKIELHGGRGGNGKNGGKGGDGGNAGQIEILFCNTSNGFTVTDHLISNGGQLGAGGSGGNGGNGGTEQGGSKKLPNGNNGGVGVPGDHHGINSTPDVKQLEPTEFWGKVAIELGIPV